MKNRTVVRGGYNGTEAKVVDLVISSMKKYVDYEIYVVEEN